MAKYRQLLEKRKEKGSLRSLLSFENAIDFWSNDYLGFGREQQLVNLSSGSGSRLISGNSLEIIGIEKYVASFFRAESALIFNSGYDANLGFFSSVPQKGEIVLYDELVHASVRDGLRLCLAQSYSFRHNDLEHLKERLNKYSGQTIWVVVESIYSMDGDIAPLHEMSLLCQIYGAHLIVDEAHAGGVFGENGSGLCNSNPSIQTFARLYTFGKGFGAHGAAILGSSELIEYLINFARSFIYTTALPSSFYNHIRNQLQRQSTEGNERRKCLVENIRHFRSQIHSDLSAPDSPIQVIPFETLSKCFRVVETLNANNIAAKAILPPTIPEGSQRVRICIHAHNTLTDIDLLCKIIRLS